MELLSNDKTFKPLFFSVVNCADNLSLCSCWGKYDDVVDQVHYPTGRGTSGCLAWDLRTFSYSVIQKYLFELLINNFSYGPDNQL